MSKRNGISTLRTVGFSNSLIARGNSGTIAAASGAIRLPDRTLRWLIAIFSVLGSFALLLFLQFFAPFLPPIGNVIAAIVILGSIMAYAIIWGLFKAEAEKGKEILFNVLDVEQVRKPEYHFGRM